jgi:hypothetical protein
MARNPEIKTEKAKPYNLIAIGFFISSQIGVLNYTFG